MKKLLLVALTLLLSTSTIFAINVGILNGPSCIPVAYLMEEEKSSNLDLSYEMFATPQVLLPKLLKKEVDIGFMPVNVAAKAYSSSGGAVICAGVCGNGNLALITKDKSITSFADLNGKTVYVAGQGASPEYITRYLIEKYNIKAELDFSIPTANIPASLISNQIEYAIVPEPFATIATTKSSEVFYAIDLQSEYTRFSKMNSYPLTCIVVRADFAKEHPEQVKSFLQKYSQAVSWTIKNPAKAGQYCEKNELGLAAGVVTKAIPKSNYVYISSSNARKETEELLKIFLQNSPEAIGGKLPDSDFYFE